MRALPRGRSSSQCRFGSVFNRVCAQADSTMSDGVTPLQCHRNVIIQTHDFHAHGGAIMKLGLTAALVLLCCLAIASPAFAGTFVNGGFEDGTFNLNS